MGSIIEALSGFTGHVKLLQTRIQNLSHNIIPRVLNSAKTLSTELSQLSPEVLKNLHNPTTLLNTGTNVSLSAPDIQTSIINTGGTESNEQLYTITLELLRETPYDKRSHISYPEAALEIGEAYQFNHGLFKDTLNSSYKTFISTIGKEFTACPKESDSKQQTEERLQKAIEAVKSPFTSWLNNFNSVHCVTAV